MALSSARFAAAAIGYAKILVIEWISQDVRAASFTIAPRRIQGGLAHIRRETHRIPEPDRSASHVPIRAHPTPQPNRITLHIPPGAWLVVSEVVVVSSSQRPFSSRWAAASARFWAADGLDLVHDRGARVVGGGVLCRARAGAASSAFLLFPLAALGAFALACAQRAGSDGSSAQRAGVSPRVGFGW